MRFKRTITLLVVIIAVFSLIASASGMFSGWGRENMNKTFQSIYGEEITIYGKGLYQRDSVSVAAQAIAQDLVTLVMGIPVLLITLVKARRNSLKGRLLLAGTIGYFLYTYCSYSFLSMYNSFFLIYVLLMSASLFAFILCIIAIDLKDLKQAFSPRLPVKFLGGFQIFIAFAVFMMWMGRIVPPMLSGIAPAGIEFYTTLVIQALDLGIIVPTAALSGILLMKRQTFGYLLSSIVIFKGMTMTTALTAMVVSQLLAGVSMSTIEVIMFPLFNLVNICCLVLLIRGINEQWRISKTNSISS